jgi:hypothetical protein
VLQIQYHANFKFRPTLLFASAASDVCQLLEVFRDCDGEEIDLLQHLRQVEGRIACDSVTGISCRGPRRKEQLFGVDQ